jgi:hypothetical protein
MKRGRKYDYREGSIKHQCRLLLDALDNTSDVDEWEEMWLDKEWEDEDQKKWLDSIFKPMYALRELIRPKRKNNIYGSLLKKKGNGKR